MTIGEKIKKFRKEAGFTQKQLATECGVAEITIRQYESGKRQPRFEQLQIIANALGMYLFEFLDDDYFDVATDDEPGAEENELKFLDKKTSSIKKILNNNNLKDKEKENILHDHIIQTKIMANMHKENAEQLRTIIINTEQATSHPFYILQKKVENGELLTEEEKTQFNAYMKDAISSLSNALKKFGETLKDCYQLLNDEGQKKADEQIEHAVKQVEMLTKIPEYQRKEYNDD